MIRFSHYVEEEFEDAVALAEEQKTSAISEWMDKQIEGSKFGDQIASNLARADLKLRPAEYVAAMVIAAFLLGFFAWAIGGQEYCICVNWCDLRGYGSQILYATAANQKINNLWKSAARYAKPGC